MRRELGQLHYCHPQRTPTHQRQALGGKITFCRYVSPPRLEEQETPHQSPHGTGIGDE